MKSKAVVPEGIHFWSGNVAVAEGAIAAGCRFYAGYPITPSSEIAEHMAARLPQVGGKFIEMEDELGSMAAIIGASWGGVKSMTATSGPGFSLMQENIGLAIMMEAPCVVVDVQRAAPSTGLPTMIGQGDVMQARFGSHGSYDIIALYPNSPNEAFHLVIDAFNLAEKFRTPVIFLMDEVIAHMYEKVHVPPPEEIEKKIVWRKTPKVPRERFKPYEYDEDLIPPMPIAGQGYRFHTTGLTHDERGYPNMSPEAQEKLIKRIYEKISSRREDLAKVETHLCDDAEVVVVAYGITSRIAKMAVDLARKEGIKAGLLRLITIWPFPSHIIKKLAEQADFVVAEINHGQISREVERHTGARKVKLVPRMGGTVHRPEEILRGIREVAGR